MRFRAFLLAVALLVSVASVSASDVPSAHEFLGYEIGERFTSHERLLDYFEMLAERSPLVTLHRFGETWEGRPLVYAVITSERNQGRIDSIRDSNRLMDDPLNTTSEQARKIANESPVVVWLAYGVHGSEASSSEAAILTAEWLTSGNAEVSPILDGAVVIIDPLENPDGRERYVEGYRQRVGTHVDSNPDGREHSEPWPGGRNNHYLVDMNRDWAWATQPETRARIQAFRLWAPQVFVDLHEMGHRGSYFFPPSAKPVNSNVDPDSLGWLEIFGRENGKVFSEKGWGFFVGEVYDLFYPGYGDSWPSLRGAIGMTFEMAGGAAAATSVEREDGTILTLRDRAIRHATSSITTIRTAVANRRELLLHKFEALRRQLEKDPLTFLILPDSPNFPRAVELLRTQGIRVTELARELSLKATSIGNRSAGPRTFPTGTLVVSTRQPLGALVRTLLEQSPELPADFLEEQRAKVEADETHDFYDLTGWSIPVSHNLDAFVYAGTIRTDLEREISPGITGEFHPARYGYVIDGLEPEIYRVVGALLRDRIRFSVSQSPLELASGSFSRGSLVIRRGNNDDGIEASLETIAESTGVKIVSVDSGWDGGTALGSLRIRHVRDPAIALFGGDGTSPTSFGSLWFTLDVDANIPHTVIDLEDFNSIDLGQYRVVVLPDGSGYQRHLGQKGVETLERWIRNGGTVVAVGRAGAFLRDKDVEISSATTWSEREEDEGESAEKRHTDFEIPGAAFRTRMNERSHLTFGLEHSPSVLLEGSTTLLALPTKADNIVTIEEKDALVTGFVWPESLERVAGSAYLISEPLGEGRVITFVDEPHYRMFWRGTLPLFMNAVLYTPSFTN